MANNTADATMPAQGSAASTDSQGGVTSQFWCNFCDFRSDDPKAYLAHSCREVLAARGVEVKPTGKNECS